MRLNSNARQILWLLLALIALLGTWAQILDYLKPPVMTAQVKFWQDTLLQPASRFTTIDLIFVCAAASVWMLSEARRLRIPWAWLYIVYGCLIAFSSALPLFMCARERAFARRWEDDNPLSLGSQLGVLALVVFACGYLCFASRAAFPG